MFLENSEILNEILNSSKDSDEEALKELKEMEFDPNGNLINDEQIMIAKECLDFDDNNQNIKDRFDD